MAPRDSSPFLSVTGDTLPLSNEAQTMVDAGVAPHVPDVAALLAQIQKLQGSVDSMRAAQGIPANPVEFAVNNLRDHVQARKNAWPGLDTAEVDALLNTDIDARGAELLGLAVDDLVAANGGRDFEYLRQLARDVRKAVLVNGGQTEAQAALTLRGVAS